MTPKLVRIATVAVALALLAGPASAQLLNQPVYYSPAHGTGFTIAADFGFGLNDDAELVTGEKPLAYGVHLTLGAPKVTVTGAVAAVDARDPTGTVGTEIAFGANVGVSVFDVPLVPVAISLQGGIGYIKFSGSGVPGSDVTFVDVPIGAAVGIKVPSPALAVTPWAAPRLHISRVSNGTSQTEVGFGVSAGLNLGLPNGLGFHTAIDWMTIEFDPLLGSQTPVRFGIGINYKFSIPGLGMVGM